MMSLKQEVSVSVNYLIFQKPVEKKTNQLDPKKDIRK